MLSRQAVQHHGDEVVAVRPDQRDRIRRSIRRADINDPPGGSGITRHRGLNDDEQTKDDQGQGEAGRWAHFHGSSRSSTRTQSRGEGRSGAWYSSVLMTPGVAASIEPCGSGFGRPLKGGGGIRHTSRCPGRSVAQLPDRNGRRDTSPLRPRGPGPLWFPPESHPPESSPVALLGSILAFRRELEDCRAFVGDLHGFSGGGNSLGLPDPLYASGRRICLAASSFSRRAG